VENSAPTPAQSAIWHIVWQVTAGHDLVANPALVARIRSRLLGAHRGPKRELLHYLLTPTEIHLLSRLPAGESPGELARAIGNIVARWVHQAQGVAGLVFAGPYRAYAIESDDAARGELRMLAWRPVSLRLARAPTHHASSSLRATLGLRRIEGFDVRKPLRLFAGALPDARVALRTLIALRPTAVETLQWEFTRGMVPVPIDAGTFSNAMRPLKGMTAALVATSRPQSIDGALRLLERWVLSKLGLHEGDHLAASHSKDGARVHALVASLAVHLGLCSASAVARHFHRAKATLSERMAACRHSPEDAAMLSMPLARVVKEAIDLQARLAESAQDVELTPHPRTTR
jgi:hypothetical protein